MKINRKRIILMGVLLLVLAGLIFLTVYLKNVAEYKMKVKRTSFDPIIISDISDGVYVGEYDVNFIYAKVRVKVQNGEITNIDLIEHRNERGKPAESIADKIVEEQRIDVDAVSGATNSSIVIKKAVENALKGAPAQD